MRAKIRHVSRCLAAAPRRQTSSRRTIPFLNSALHRPSPAKAAGSNGAPFAYISSEISLHTSSRALHDKQQQQQPQSQDAISHPLTNPATKKQREKDYAAITAQNLAQVSSTLQNAKITSHETLIVRDVEAPGSGSIRILSLNRPAARNAISKQLLKELSEQVEAVHAQGAAGEVRVLVVASEVDGAFCAGADLKERRDMSQDEVQTFLTSLRRTFSRLAALPIPTISSISGPALGGGLELALCTSFRVLSSNASLALPETRLAIIPGAGGTYRLPAIVGHSNALDLILTGRRITTMQAVKMGLGQFSDLLTQGLDVTQKRNVALWKSLQIAGEISKGGPLAIAAAMRAMSEGPSEVAENVAYDSLLHTKDRVEALTAFGEKRSPQFKGE